MLKIKKLKPEDLEQLEFNLYKKVLKQLMNELKRKHTDAENAVDFFIKTNFEFVDKPGKKVAIIIPGKQNAVWKKYLKECFKSDKKTLLMGTCFATDKDGEQLLNIEPVRGLAKMNLIKKQSRRIMALAGMKLGLASGIDDNEEEETIVNAAAKAAAGNSTKTKEELRAELDALTAALTALKADFQAIKNQQIPDKLKSQQLKEEDALLVDKIVVAAKSFLNAYKQADPRVQARIEEPKSNFEAQLPKLLALQKKIAESLAAQKNLSKEKTMTAEEEAILVDKMRKTKANIQQALQGIDLDALLEAMP